MGELVNNYIAIYTYFYVKWRGKDGGMGVGRRGLKVGGRESGQPAKGGA